MAAGPPDPGAQQAVGGGHQEGSDYKGVHQHAEDDEEGELVEQRRARGEEAAESNCHDHPRPRDDGAATLHAANDGGGVVPARLALAYDAAQEED